MTPSGNLFDLIHSLSRNEKRYFKRYSGLHVQGEQNNYTLLFDAIASQKKYDEKKLIEKFRSYTFTKQFSVAKTYLYNQVLNAMQSYYTSIHTEARCLLQNAEFLFEKELYDQATKVVTKAKIFAKKYELHWVLLEISQLWEFRIALKKSDMKWLERILKGESDEITLIQNTKSFHDIFWRILIYKNVHGTAREKIQKKIITKMLRNPLLQNESLTKTFKAKLSLYQAHVFFANIISNNARRYKYSYKIIEHFHNHPEKIPLFLDGYANMLNNAVLACHLIKKYNEASVYINEMKGLLQFAKSSSQKTHLFYTYYKNHLEHLTDTGQFSLAIKFIEVKKPHMNEVEYRINEFEKTILFYDTALSYFGAEEYSKSIFWLNRIRNEIALPAMPDVESFLRLFYLIVHYEAGNTDLLPYLIQSTYRFFRKKEWLYQFEKIVIDFMKNKFPNANSQKEIIVVFKKLYYNILPLANNQYEKNAFEFFDYISWLESKIRNKSFAEIIKEKAKK